MRKTSIVYVGSDVFTNSLIWPPRFTDVSDAYPSMTPVLYPGLVSVHSDVPGLAFSIWM